MRLKHILELLLAHYRKSGQGRFAALVAELIEGAPGGQVIALDEGEEAGEEPKPPIMPPDTSE